MMDGEQRLMGQPEKQILLRGRKRQIEQGGGFLLLCPRAMERVGERRIAQLCDAV